MRFPWSQNLANGGFIADAGHSYPASAANCWNADWLDASNCRLRIMCATPVHDSCDFLSDFGPVSEGLFRVGSQEPSDFVETNAEDGFCVSPMRLSRPFPCSGPGGCHPCSPCHGQGNETDRQARLSGDRETGVFQVEALCLRFGEQAFDGPAFAIGGQGVMGGSVADNDRQFLTLDAPGCEVQPERRSAPAALKWAVNVRGPRQVRSKVRRLCRMPSPPVTYRFDFTRMMKGTSCSCRKVNRSRPINPRSAGRHLMLPDPNRSGQRFISAMRSLVLLLPALPDTVRISGTRQRRVATAGTNRLISLRPIFRFVRSRHRCRLPESPGIRTTGGADRSFPRLTC